MSEIVNFCFKGGEKQFLVVKKFGVLWTEASFKIAINYLIEMSFHKSSEFPWVLTQHLLWQIHSYSIMRMSIRYYIWTISHSNTFVKLSKQIWNWYRSKAINKDPQYPCWIKPLANILVNSRLLQTQKIASWNFSHCFSLEVYINITVCFMILLVPLFVCLYRY